jgi:hypothetical protein
MPRFAGTSTPVTAAAGWDSGPMQAGLSDRVKGMVFSDQNGDIFIEQSADNGANWDVSTTYPVVANDGSGFSEELVGPIFRVRFVPDADTTVFRISVNTSSAGPR